MLTGSFYHKTIRKIVAAFGTIFNEINIVRYDNARENEIHRFKVPLTYASKEKFIYDLQYDTAQQKSVQIQLPRMSFDLTGLTYDAARKLVSINRNYQTTSNNQTIIASYNPVPYDFDFELNIYTRTIEDMSQIIEQIIPLFTPDYTVTVELANDNGFSVTRDIPLLLRSVAPQFDTGQTNDDVRYVYCTMQFSMKAYLFGAASNSSIIRKAITNIYDNNLENGQTNLVMSVGGIGDFREEEEVYVGDTFQSATWRGRVLTWNSSQRRLDIYAITGGLPQVDDVVIGFDTDARWTVFSTDNEYLKLVRIEHNPTPNTVNVGNTQFTVNTVIQEFPDINE